MKNKILFLVIIVIGFFFSFKTQNVLAASTEGSSCTGKTMTEFRGVCKNSCDAKNSEAPDGICVDSRLQCCITTTPGKCTSSSLALAGSCKKACVSPEKSDGTCRLGSRASFKGLDCCVVPPATVDLTSGASSGGSTDFINPLGSITTVEALLGNIMGAVQKIIVTLALVAIVVGALMYVTSAGVEKQTTQAKEAISAALIGMAIAVAAPSLLKELAGVLGWTTDNSKVNEALTLSAIALKVLSFLLGTFGVISLIMMIIGASLYMTSAGDEDRMKKGKDVFKYAVLGVVIAMSAMILVRQIAKFFVA